jgi:acyl carrier protein phosphodiesterase
MISPDQTDDLPAAILEGIQLHRSIDVFTDGHADVRKSTARIRKKQRKYAPVSIDVYYDFLLVRNWDRYASVDLDEMAEYLYRNLGNHMDLVPQPLQKRVLSMIDHKWLSTYRSEDGIGNVFRRMAHRASRPEIILQALEHLLEQDEGLQSDFNHFFPDMISHVLSVHPYGNEWLIPQNERTA